MKRIYIFLIGLCIAFSGCKKGLDDNINGVSTDERLSEALTAYQKVLTSAPNGWKMVVFPEGLVATNGIQSAFSYYMNFTPDNRVNMLSDFNQTTASTVQSSSYRLKALQRPTLLFDTYSYASLPSNPDLDYSNSPTGNSGPGWGSDFQFAFTENFKVIGDTVRLEGILNHSKAYMVRATKEEQAFYTSSKFASSMVLDLIQNYFKRVTIGGQSDPLFEMTPSLGGKGVEVNYLDPSGVLKTSVVNYYYVAGSIQFLQPFSTGGEQIKSIENIVFNQVTSSATCTINGKQATLAGATAPLKPDLASADKWYNAGINGNYISHKGFHVNGVDDAFGLLKYKDPGNGFPCLGYIYAPEGFFGISIAAPLLLDVDHNAYAFGAFTFSFPARTEDKIYFSTVGSDADAPGKTATLLGDSLGYHAILKADGKNWDMVSVRDAKAWIRWSL